MFSNPAKNLAVVATVTPWHEPPRIRHQATRQLSRFYNVLYVELPLESDRKFDELETINDSLVIFRPRKQFWWLRRIGNYIPIVRHVYNKMVVNKIESTIRACGYETAALVTFQFDLPEIMVLGVFDAKIYFCNDDFVIGARPAWKRRLYASYEAQVAHNADLCLAVSDPLVAKLRYVNANTELLLPGHEFKMDEPGQYASRSRADRRSIHVGFMGYINDRICFDWLEALIKIERIKLRLIGADQTSEGLLILKGNANFEHLKPLGDSALKKCLEECDVLIIPYDSSKAVLRVITAPNKLFQYLACGKPIVISDLPHFIELPDKFIYRASTAQEFVTQVLNAFQEDCAECYQARLDYAARNTWDVRGDQLHEHLQIIRSRHDKLQRMLRTSDQVF